MRTLGGAPEWREVIQKMFGGTELPADDKKQARSMQFEAFVAASLRRSGLVVASDEPDVRVNFKGWRLGVAAKRIRSATQLRHRLADANRQMIRARLPGVIAIEVSQILNLPSHDIEAHTLAAAQQTMVSSLTSLTQRWVGEVASRLNHDHILAVVAFATRPVVASDYDGIQSSAATATVYTMGDADCRSDRIGEFCNALVEQGRS